MNPLMRNEYDESIKCQLCGCEIYDHPTISIPVGSATCSCGCPLTAKMVYWMDLGKKNDNK